MFNFFGKTANKFLDKVSNRSKSSSEFTLKKIKILFKNKQIRSKGHK